MSKLINKLMENQFDAAIHGDFEKAAVIAARLERQFPEYDELAFNRGQWLLRNGHFAKGYACLDRGRRVRVFGNVHPGSAMPIWEGERYATVVINLEGGLGDQIHGARFAHLVENAAGKVILACSAELAELFNTMPAVSAVCQNEALCGVYHEYWLPSMSAPLHLGHTRACGAPYIARSKKMIKGRIGVCWKGNPEFEHEQNRLFPKELMFDAVKGFDAVTLQKHSSYPRFIKEVPLDNWCDTRGAISQCEVVVTSCTSVAHLSGAMGVETWIIVPILPYYLWAVPGESTDYYDSVTLFRQQEYGDWVAPFSKLRERLDERFVRAR